MFAGPGQFARATNLRPRAGYRSHFKIGRTAFVSTYAPRHCGVATFTYDLATTVGEREIVALHPVGEAGPYPAEVRRRIRRDIQADYPYVAQALNDSGVEVVSIQFDPSIWGGEDGEYILDFVRGLKVPCVVTLHSVDLDPTPHQRQILSALVSAAESTVVMSAAARDALVKTVDTGTGRIELLPYGVPHLPLVAPDSIKPKLGLQGKDVVLSFGLLAPDKGFESMIAAMPAVIEAAPNARYVIVGATGPETISAHGETYRASLEAQVQALKLGEYVKFIDRFVGRVELASWLEAADVFVAPSSNLGQTVCGSLAYAMAAGKPIVSTRSAYAEEKLGDGLGIFVAPNSPAELASAVGSLLADPELRETMGKRVYERSRPMVWWTVGDEYRRVFDRASRKLAAWVA